MYDKGQTITLLVIFVLLITFPIWYNNFLGDVGAVPTKDPNLTPEMVQGAVFPNDQKHLLAQEMRAKHMDVLKGIHVNAQGYDAAKDGEKPTMSCIGCHYGVDTPLQFCNSCHAYAAVSIPECWSCHKKP